MGAPITSLAISMDSVFAAAGNFVGRYVRGKEIERFVLSSAAASSRTSTTSDSDSDSSSGSSSSSSSDSDSDSDSDMDDEDELSPIAESIGTLTLFGSTLVALSSTGKRMYVWDIPAYANPASKDPKAAEQEDAPTPTSKKPITPYATLDFPAGFTATKVVHPASYLNKIVVGSKEGELAVWNVRTG